MSNLHSITATIDELRRALAGAWVDAASGACSA